jgi:hypothetical protein
MDEIDCYKDILQGGVQFSIWKYVRVREVCPLRVFGGYTSLLITAANALRTYQPGRTSL